MYDIYLVKEGDTIESIANKYGTDVDTLIRLNGELIPLTPGLNVVVPKNGNSLFDTYIIQKGDNLYQIAQKYNINPDVLSQINGLNKTDYIYPNQQILVPKKDVRIYITAEGDTFDGIVKGLDANLTKLLSQNNKIFLYPGQLIVYRDQ